MYYIVNQTLQMLSGGAAGEKLLVVVLLVQVQSFSITSCCFDTCSPEHPVSRARERSMLGGDRQLFREYADGVIISRSITCLSDGASTSDACRARRRSISFTPEIGDDIVRLVLLFLVLPLPSPPLLLPLPPPSATNFLSRAVRAMNDALKQKRFLRDHDGEGSGSYSMNDKCRLNDPPSNVCILVPRFSNACLFNDRLNNLFHLFLGFFGEVFRGIWNGTDVAIKVFLEQDLTTENVEDFCNEISILRYHFHVTYKDLKFSFYFQMLFSYYIVFLFQPSPASEW
ncbi:hypothetical protein B296_00030963 [Ensete ventricosum]|uniref:Protein kinase domain-containing protein n=1 Tax=Ensete ventricosum TaxID=4639 RepID=A0A426YQ88_ENSVE|nr:hypothetical protein B296_00030963 [Ensete ventricosum]